MLAMVLLPASKVFAMQGTGEVGAMRWAPSRTYHVENYTLALHFSQSRGEVFGNELVTIKPFESNFRRFCLNSTELTIESVTLVRAGQKPQKLIHTTDGQCLWISLKHPYNSEDVLDIRIVYHGFPRAGLYFVNPGRDDPHTPPEIYTQGEPEFNHYWFPCWDYPNDMATSETITTVPEGQVVVSNGKLVSVKHSGDQVTYDWVEHIPHSSYLTSIAVGPWKKISDSYDGIPVDYYVADSVADAVAERTFHLTPDMIGFFSRVTGVTYPYEKYDQVVVHDFIFGGQENVSATTLTDRTLHDARAELDYPSTILVAHELGQHWFGDYVQGRDWANIWLNEGFATYLTALYTQYHEGNNAYRYEIFQDQNTALKAEKSENDRPLVYRGYLDPMDMLEEITHQKGASVLDMLRYVLDGDAEMSAPASQSEPLFKALEYYLTVHHAQTADTADLLGSIRASTGKDPGWFFYEWMFKGGHPDYRVSASYDTKRKAEVVRITQTQIVDANTPVFDMPVQLAFFGDDGQKLETRVRDDLVDQEFVVPLGFHPLWVDFDPDDILYKQVAFDKTTDQLIRQAQDDPHMMSRLWAAKELGKRLGSDQGRRVQALATVMNDDPFYGVRIAAASSLGRSGSKQAEQALLSAMNQPNSQVRAAAIAAMGNFLGDPKVINVLTKAMHNDPSYAVEAAAAEQLGRSGGEEPFDALRSELASAPSTYVTVGVLNGMAFSKRREAASIVLSYAQPGRPQRVRLTALSDLPMLKRQLERSGQVALGETVGAALSDPFLPVHELGDHLVDVFRLEQFKPVIEHDASNAVMIDDRAQAKRILDHLAE